MDEHFLLSEIDDIQDDNDQDQIEEAEYRRGYRDGWIQAVNALGNIWFLKKKKWIVALLFNFWKISLAKWQETRQEDRFFVPPSNVLLCAYCRKKRAEHIDHFIPKHHRGSNKSSNLVPSCRFCNASKGKKWPNVWKRGLNEPPWHFGLLENSTQVLWNKEENILNDAEARAATYDPWYKFHEESELPYDWEQMQEAMAKHGLGYPETPDDVDW